MTPSVDVAIVSFNHEPYLGPMFDSVLGQRTDFPVRIIVGDDCSSDRSQEVIREYASRFPDRIVPILHERNLGLFHPDRIGFKVLRACSAKYVALLDGDDYWIAADKLQRQVDWLEHHPECSISHHAIEMRFEDGRSRPIKAPIACKPIATIEDLLGGFNFIHTCSLVYRRQCLPEQPAWFAQLPLGDWPLCCLLAQSGNIAYIDRVMAVYRVRGGSSWFHKPDAYRVDAVVRMYRELRNHLDVRHFRQITETLARMSAELAFLHKSSGNKELAQECVRDSVQYLLELEDPQRPVVRPIMGMLVATLTGESHLPGRRFDHLGRGIGQKFPWSRPALLWIRRLILGHP